MRQADKIRHFMYDRAGREAIMTADEEKDLARKIRDVKLELLDRLLSDPPTLEKSLEFCERAGKKHEKKREISFSNEHFEGLAIATRAYRRRPIKANEALMRRARDRVCISLMDFDPCMEIALALFHQVKAWQVEQHPNRRETYARYLKSIDIAWKRYVYLRNRFIERNIRLVMTISKRFASFGIPQEDLIQEGTFGLQKAVGMFDPERGFKFSTYATWWIRATILRYCRDTSRIVRLPVHTQEKLERYYASIKALEAKRGESPDDKELAEETALPIETIKKLRKLSLEPHYSTDRQLRDDLKFEDLLPDPENFVEYTNTEFVIETLRKLCNALPERQKKIIYARFNLDGAGGKTLQEIADTEGVTRERIRQLEAMALKTIRGIISRDQLRIDMGLTKIVWHEFPRMR